MRKYVAPGCVGRGLDLGLRIRPAAPAPAPAAASGNPGLGPLGILGVAQKSGFFQTPFLRVFEKLEPAFFKTSFFCGFLKNGGRPFFKNLKFSKSHLPAIQKMLILS